MAVRFDNPADRLSYSGTLFDPSAGMTIALWALWDDSTGVTAPTLLRVNLSGTGNGLITGTEDGSDGPIYFSSTGSVRSQALFPIGEWRRIAITRSGTTGWIYAGAATGATDADTAVVGGAAVPTEICLAGRAAADAINPFNGRLAFVRIWTAALSQAEIEAEWMSPTPIRTANIFANWPLNSATDLTDTVGAKTLTVQSGGALTDTTGPPIPVPNRQQPYVSRRRAANW